MFVFEVCRINERLPLRVYRSFDEVLELYNGLKRRFHPTSLPLLNNMSGLRSNNENTAKIRQGALQIFFMRLLELKDEIATVCFILYKVRY